MQDKPTNELDELLKSMNPNQLEEYYRTNAEYLISGDRPFYHYLKERLDVNHIKLKDIFVQSNVTESYGGQIVRMEKRTKNRDLIIRFCISGHLHVDEINRALKLYGMEPLYAKDKRDACIIVAVHKRYDLYDIDDLLEASGFLKLSTDMDV